MAVLILIAVSYLSANSHIRPPFADPAHSSDIGIADHADLRRILCLHRTLLVFAVYWSMVQLTDS